MSNAEILDTIKSINAICAGLVRLLEAGAEPTPAQIRDALLQKRDLLNVQLSQCRDPLTREMLAADAARLDREAMEVET